MTQYPYSQTDQVEGSVACLAELSLIFFPGISFGIWGIWDLEPDRQGEIVLLLCQISVSSAVFKVQSAGSYM